MAGSLEPFLRQGDFRVLQDQSVRFVGRSWPYKHADDSKRESDGGGDDEHPSPSGQAMDSVEMFCCACLDQTGGQYS